MYHMATYINNTRSTSLQATLDQLVILSKVGRVQVPAKLVVDKILPAHRETEDVHVVVLDEMLHLTKSIGAVKGGDRGKCLAQVTGSLDYVSHLSAWKRKHLLGKSRIPMCCIRSQSLQCLLQL